MVGAATSVNTIFCCAFVRSVVTAETSFLWCAGQEGGPGQDQDRSIMSSKLPGKSQKLTGKQYAPISAPFRAPRRQVAELVARTQHTQSSSDAIKESVCLLIVRSLQVCKSSVSVRLQELLFIFLCFSSQPENLIRFW